MLDFGLEYVTNELPVAKSKQEEAAAAAEAAKAAEANAKHDHSAHAHAGDSSAPRERVIKPLSPGCARPVIIHRAMAGSIERFMGKR